MPASDISRFSYAGSQGVEVPALIARDLANREVGLMIESGRLDPTNLESYRRNYRFIYEQHYRRYYPLCRPHYLENPAATRFRSRHTVANFSKSNYFIHVHQGCITVGRINYPLDLDTSLETKEAFLSAWPGPLDRADEQTKNRVSDYIDTLLQHDSQRRIRYSNGSNDDHRRTILKLLAELLHRNGKIDASGITRLLLKPEQTDIQKDEASKKPLETLQKYLLMGKRGEAIRFAKTKKLWDHAQCLAFLDKYQPPLDKNSSTNFVKYIFDTMKLKDDSIVQLNDEYISTLGQNILSTVYKALLNRILQSDPESVKMIKRTNVGSRSYDFAILSANDCEMDFDQSNETFRLIVAVKNAILNPVVSFNHLISLGYTTLDSYDFHDDLSDPSHPSFKQDDTFASRALIISNIDMLILNEIWEYCLNLSKGDGVTNLSSYDYIINLLPYKLIFASRLLDYGLHTMFASYLDSIKRALSKVEIQHLNKDPFYDWERIERSVESLDRIWANIFLRAPEFGNQQSTYLDYAQQQPLQNLDYYNQPMNFNPITTLPEPLQSEPQMDYPDSSQIDYSYTPYQLESNYVSTQNNNYFPQQQQQHQQQDTLVSELPTSRETYPEPPIRRDFPEPPEPVRQEVATLYRPDFASEVAPLREPEQTLASIEETLPEPPTSSTSFSKPFIAPKTTSEEPALSEDQGQQSNFFTQLVGSAKSLLPKSNSKQMILPDDSSKSIIYDPEKRAWVDKSRPEEAAGAEILDAPPMLINTSKPTSYSFGNKPSKLRYPKAQF